MKLRHEDGATAVEYAIIASLIAMVIFVSVSLLGSATSDSMCEPLDEMAAQGVSVDQGACQD